MKDLYDALDKFHSKTQLVKATKENPYFKNKYADYNIIVSETRDDLKECGLRIKQTITNIDGKTAVRTFLMHLKSGEYIEDVAPVESKPNDPQAQGSGITYQKRYSYVTMLDLLVDVDDDGNLQRKLEKKDKKAASGFDEAEKSLKAAKSVGDLQKRYSSIYTKNPALGRSLVPLKDKLKEKLGGADADS